MHPAGFEPAIPASEQAQTHVFESAATGIGSLHVYFEIKCISRLQHACYSYVTCLDVIIFNLIIPEIYDDDDDEAARR